MWYPDKDLIIKVHELMLKLYGGYPGFERGIDAYDAILEEVKEAKGVYRKAAILLRRIVRARIFQDANHRTAQIITEIFLKKNNAEMATKEPKIVIKFIKDILYYNIDEIEEWLKNGTLPKRH